MTFAVTVELHVAGAWLDITGIDDDTKLLDSGGVVITRGRSDQQGRVAPTEVRFNYRDNTGMLDGDNPASPYYRQVGLGTPLRVKVDGDVRAVVEVVQWEPSWDDIDHVVTVAVVGAGILRRLEDGRKPLRSPAYRAFTAAVNDPVRVAYWPFEEESGATTVSSPYAGTVTLGGSAQINFRAVESMSSAGLAEFGDVFTFLTFTLPPWTDTLGQHFVGSLVRWPSGGLNDNLILWRLYFTDGDIDYVDLLHNTGNILRLVAYQGGVVVDTMVVTDWTGILDDREAFLINTFQQVGSDVAVRIRATSSENWLFTGSDTMPGRTLGRMYQLVMNTGQAQAGWAFGHVIVGSNRDSFGNFIDDQDSSADALVTGARGYVGERAGARMLRIADDEGIPIALVGSAADTERLGPQGSDTAPEMIYAGADTDLGILYEARDALELRYRTRVDLYNQVPAATLSYGHLTKPFRPATGDLRVTNSVTAQRDGGGTASYSIPDGDLLHWTTEDPPAGAGPRESEAQPDVAEDAQLGPQAAWRAHLAAWREKRFRQVTYELASTAFTAEDRAAIRALDLGDVIAQGTVGAPPYAPYDEIRLMAQGCTETCSTFLHTFAFNTTPADAYEVEVTDVTGSTLVMPIDDNDTTIRIEPPDGPEWSTSDEPYHIQVGGQPMTVTAMANMTPAFIAAGVVAHGNNASVVPALPAGITPDVGQLLLIWCAIRNSGTGTVSDLSGWERLTPAGINVALFGRYYQAGDTAPTVAFAGGVANADTSAQMAAFSGLSMQHAGSTVGAWVSAAVAAAGQLNGSAQNIGLPAPVYVNFAPGVILFLGWKQDDWTSVATLGDAEIGEPDTTTGDDQGIVWAYDVYSATGTNSVTEFAVTGGASAISRGFKIALRALQEATVERGIASTPTSAAIGAEVHAWRPGLNGL